MDSWRLAPSLEAPAVNPVSLRRRRYYRHQIHSLAYLNLDQHNGGILRNLGEAGIAVQAVASLSPGQQVFLRFDLTNPRGRVEGTGRVIWADSFGQAGIEFVSLSQRARRALREWIFIQLLSIAHQASESNIVGGNIGEAAELLFSSSSRPAIRLPQITASRTDDRSTDTRPRVMHLPWLPFSISATALARLVDGLILLCAMLLFAVIGMAMVGAVPAWPILVVLGLGVASVFTFVYRFLFLFWIGATPGNYLAQLTDNALNGMNPEAEDRPRFR